MQVKLLPVMYITGVLKSQKKLDYMVSCSNCLGVGTGVGNLWIYFALDWAAWSWLPNLQHRFLLAFYYMLVFLHSWYECCTGIWVSRLLSVWSPQARHDSCSAQLHVFSRDQVNFMFSVSTKDKYWKRACVGFWSQISRVVFRSGRSDQEILC